MLLDVLHEPGVEPELLDDLLIALEELDGVPAQEALVNLTLNALLDVGDGVLHAALEYAGDTAGLVS